MAKIALSLDRGGMHDALRGLDDAEERLF